MILSMGSWSLMHFVDRVFLTWYSRDALAAALPSGILSFTLGTFFLGTAGYVNTFVAQYMGANRPERVGASVWQGIHFSILAGLFLLVGIPFAPWIFDAAGHEPSIRALEVVYFQILMVGWLPTIFPSHRWWLTPLLAPVTTTTMITITMITPIPVTPVATRAVATAPRPPTAASVLSLCCFRVASLPPVGVAKRSH